MARSNAYLPGAWAARSCAPYICGESKGIACIGNNSISPIRAGRTVARWMREWNISPDPFRIPWGKLKIGLNTVIADVEAEKTPALEWELWLRKKVIGRIPGA